jgi:hypothetical protein
LVFETSCTPDSPPTDHGGASARRHGHDGSAGLRALDLARKIGRAKVGVRWSRPWLDFLSARASRVSARQWLSWTLGSEAKSLVSFDDPMPLLRGKIWESFARRFRR